MPTRTLTCPYSEELCTVSGRHEHPYTLGRFGTRRCQCGSRRWSVNVSRQLPPSVVCDQCGKTNISATAYECGRAEGPRGGKSNDDTPSF